MSTNMKDKELKEWTARGSHVAGYWVAEVEGIVAGTVAYTISGDMLEIHRLSTDGSFRKLGLASLLVKKMESTAREYGCSYIEAVASDIQIPAMKFYERMGYNMVAREPFFGNTDFSHIITYKKSL